jgi:glycosyltransferase involved in cell wall biosynthesis
MAPFVWGGAEELAAHLCKNLIAAGHEAEALRIPFQWAPATRIPSQMMMVHALELSNVDHVIALKFPAYLIRHPRKTLWLLHQYRQAYDLYDSNQSNLSATEEGRNIRQAIWNADNECFRESQAIFANSHVTQRRLAHYNGMAAEVLLPPLNDPELFCGGDPAGYIFAGGRINSMKRQHMLIEALARAPRHIRLVIAGPPDSQEEADKLMKLVGTHDLGDRVSLDLRFLSRVEYARYINEASAVAYIPYDEDSLGYVSMEAAASGKAIITTDDSGGVLGLVRHLETGWIAKPNPPSLSEVMAAVHADARFTRELGMAARESWLSLRVTWPATVARLMG